MQRMNKGTDDSSRSDSKRIDSESKLSHKNYKPPTKSKHPIKTNTYSTNRQVRMSSYTIPASPQKPMTEKAKKKALAYIKRCEESKGRNKYTFKDFESRMLDHIEDPAKEASSFISLVYDDVFSLNDWNSIPSPSSCEWITCHLLIFLTRCKARVCCGATTKYHAQMYYHLIIETLIEKKMLDRDETLPWPRQQRTLTRLTAKSRKARLLRQND